MDLKKLEIWVLRNKTLAQRKMIIIIKSNTVRLSLPIDQID